MKKYWSHIIVVIATLLTIIIAQGGCGSFTGNKQPDTVKIKTVIKWYPSKPITIHDTPFIRYEEKPSSIPEKYKPIENCDSSKKRYNELVFKYLTKNRYLDTIWYDSSFVVRRQDVKENKIESETFSFYPKIKTEITTITTREKEKPKRQLYILTAIDYSFISKTDSMSALGVSVGLAYKDRKDRVYEAKYNRNTLNQQRFEVGRLFKISFK